MVNFGPLRAEIGSGVGHPYKFQRVLPLGSVTARHSSGRHQPNFAALNRGRHLCSAGRPSGWALAHILVPVCSNVSILHRFRGTTIFTMHVTACHLEKFFRFDITVNITGHVYALRFECKTPWEKSQIFPASHVSGARWSDSVTFLGERL